MKIQEKQITFGIIVFIFVASAIFFLMKEFVLKEYTVTFNTDGGTSISSIKVKKNKTINEPEAPLKANYTFDG